MQTEVYNGIFCKTVTGRDMVIKASCVDAYISIKDSDGADTVRIYMSNGNIVECMNEVDEEVYPGDSLETLLDASFEYTKISVD